MVIHFVIDLNENVPFSQIGLWSHSQLQKSVYFRGFSLPKLYKCVKSTICAFRRFQVPRRMAPVPRGHRAVYRNMGIFRQWVDWYRPQFAGAVQVLARQRYTYYGVAFVVGVLAYLHMADAVDLNSLSSFR